jgi:hypothetical protein
MKKLTDYLVENITINEGKRELIQDFSEADTGLKFEWWMDTLSLSVKGDRKNFRSRNSFEKAVRAAERKNWGSYEMFTFRGNLICSISDGTENYEGTEVSFYFFFGRQKDDCKITIDVDKSLKNREEIINSLKSQAEKVVTGILDIYPSDIEFEIN